MENLAAKAAMKALENLAVKAAMKTLPTNIDGFLVDLHTPFYLSVKCK